MPTTREIRAAEAAVAHLKAAALSLAQAGSSVHAAGDMEIGTALDAVTGPHPLDAIADASAAVRRYADALKTWLGLYDQEAA